MEDAFKCTEDTLELFALEEVDLSLEVSMSISILKML